MNSTSSCRPRHRRWKIPIAMLAASAAFVGGQALAPTPAVAMFSNGPGACQFWIDCITQEETGGGGGGGNVTPGSGSPAFQPPPGEVVVVTGSKPKKCGDPGKVCIDVGGRGGGDPQIDKDVRPPRGEVPGYGSGRRPPCKSKDLGDRNPGCSQHNFKCVDPKTLKWTWTHSEDDCPFADKPKPKDEEPDDYQKKRTFCDGLQKQKDRLDHQMSTNQILEKDYADLRDDLHARWKRRGCEGELENPV